MIRNGLWAPAIRRVYASFQSSWVEQIDFVGAHSKNLTAYVLRRVAQQIDRQWRNGFRRHPLHALDPLLCSRVSECSLENMRDQAKGAMH